MGLLCVVFLGWSSSLSSSVSRLIEADKKMTAPGQTCPLKYPNALNWVPIFDNSNFAV
jgi:hypothetical protein